MAIATNRAGMRSDRAVRLHRLGGVLQLWLRMVAERDHLAALDDTRLADLGLSRADVVAEVRRPFWDVPPARWL